MARYLAVHPNIDIYGGGERVCHHIVKALVAHGQQVELLSFDFNKNHYAEIIGEKLPSEVKVHMLGNREMVEADPPFSVYKRRRNIIKLLKTYKATATYDYLFSTQMISAFETTLLKTGKRNIAYVHFPEIPYDYAHSKRSRRMYLWLYKRLLEGHIGEFGLMFCNSSYTKATVQKYWSRYGINDPIVAYPPVETPFWSDKPLEQRINRVVYVARFIPQKRHHILKQLAKNFPQLQFVSVGLLRDSEEAWFADFSKDLPSNYTLKPNLAETEKIQLLKDSTIYCHLMEGEHFGISPMEALASGCVTLTHNSGGAGDFIPAEYRWSSVEDLKEKIAAFTKPGGFAMWNSRKDLLKQKIEALKPEVFEEQIWRNVEGLMKKVGEL
jgi:glycosyltransferase involved in cell wall biosynthesis